MHFFRKGSGDVKTEFSPKGDSLSRERQTKGTGMERAVTASGE